MFYPPLYSLTTAILDSAAYFGTTRLSKLSNDGTVLVVLYGVGARHTTVHSWRKRLKHWGGRGAPCLRVACVEMNSSFVRCREADE